MTEGNPTPEPGNAELMAFMREGFERVAREMDGQRTALADLRGTVETLRLDFGAHAELEQARHVENQQAFEALASMAHEHQTELGRVEARLTSRLGDVQGVVQNVKADLAAHVSDDPHHDGGHRDAA